MKYTRDLGVGRLALGDLLAQHALGAMLDAAFHCYDAAKRGIELRVGRRLALEVRSTLAEAREEGRIARGEFLHQRRALIHRHVARMQVDSVEIHVLPVQLPLLVRLVGQPCVAREVGLRAPVLDGVAEADIAFDALGGVDFGVWIAFAVGLVAQGVAGAGRKKANAARPPGPWQVCDRTCSAPYLKVRR
ncbi:MAG: hypothetical protein M5R42_08035 [Rhodocyclaceae bacterium]|nr:hypothetical protein [Rhodocyclaceae bacterium]